MTDDADLAPTGRNGPQQQIVAEVLELGEALFDAALEAASSSPTDRHAEGDDEAFPIEDMRAAADEFFAALRALLEKP